MEDHTEGGASSCTGLWWREVVAMRRVGRVGHVSNERGDERGNGQVSDQLWDRGCACR